MSLATSIGKWARGNTYDDTWRVIGTYSRYEEAERAVDHLSDAGFPVAASAIIGHDLRLVEQVVGRMTKTRATLIGAASGAWFGLLVGALLGLFLIGPQWVVLILTAKIVGAIWGGVFGFVAHLATSGRRDFSSTRAVVADRYEVAVSAVHFERAAQMLSSLP